MSAAEVVRVNLSERSYDIEIDAGNLDSVGPFVAARAKPLSRAIVICDGNVEALYAGRVAASLRAAGAEVDVVPVEPGEPSKCVAKADLLWQRLLELGADRKTVVVAVSGGVVGDLAGFVAATYARGLAFVQVPTTLLAQVDSSVGGKVGINLPRSKNMVGAFWQPLGVLIDTDTLTSLPDREYRAGLAEVVKYGVILDADFFAYLEQHVDALNGRSPDVLRQVVARCCRLKADVVQQDEREETGGRAVLNYGHTFAHAFEAVTSYGTLLHGEAVSIGMLCASRLAEFLGRVDGEFTGRQERLLIALSLPTQVPAGDPQLFLDAMRHDKKVAHGRLRFVLPTRLGHVALVDGVDLEMARRAMQF